MSTDDLRSFRPPASDVRVPFAVEQLLGSGTFGKAWKVHLVNSKKHFAVKQVHVLWAARVVSNLKFNKIPIETDNAKLDFSA